MGEKPPVGHKYTGETGMGEKSEAAKSVECGLKKCIGETSWVKSILYMVEKSEKHPEEECLGEKYIYKPKGAMVLFTLSATTYKH